MFSTKDHHTKKNVSCGIGRYEYLKQLVNEYNTTGSLEVRKQTLANISNFAYDPINYEYFKQLHIVDLLLHQLSVADEDLLHYGLAGICNLSSDPEFRDYIIYLNGILLISNLISHCEDAIVLEAITSLYFLTEELNIPDFICEDTLNQIKRYQHHSDKRLSNISKLFLKKWHI